MGIIALLVIYVLGGLTFIPLVLAACIAVVVQTSPVVKDAGQRKVGSKDAKGGQGLPPDVAAAKSKEKATTRVYRSGWLTVRRAYDSAALEGNSSSSNVTIDPTPPAAGSAAEQQQTGYMGMMASSYRTFMDSRSKDPKRARPKDRFFAVLKDNILFLYEDDQEEDCRAAIKVARHDVVIYPEGLIDGELFMKRNAICLRSHVHAGTTGSQEDMPSIVMRLIQVPVTYSNPAEKGAGNGSMTVTETVESGGPMPWYLFPAINIDKEDWYHSLVAASRLSEPGASAADAALFDSDDMAHLVEAIDQQPDAIPTRWMNALLGRLFFAVYRTAAVENYIVGKLVKKLSKINKPSFLADIEVKEVDVGRTTPFFSKPMLKELTAEGDMSMEMQVKYTGDFRITIATVATLNLGTRFKSYSVRLVLALVLKELEGSVLLRIKRPPSNRVWWAFTTTPRMVLNVEPVVSTRQIKWSMITKPIESRLREVIMETLVMPHMDDIAFMNTKPYANRAGIYADAGRKATDLPSGAAANGTGPSAADEEEEDSESGLPPGIPNVKLSDDRPEVYEGLRQRGSKKTDDDAASIRSSKTVPIQGSNGKDHNRRSSWFTLGGTGSNSTTSLPATTAGASRASSTGSEASIPSPHPTSSAPNPSNALEDSASASAPTLASSAPKAGQKRVGPSKLSKDADLGENTDGAAERLRGILESQKIRDSVRKVSKSRKGSQESDRAKDGHIEPSKPKPVQIEPSTVLGTGLSVSVSPDGASTASLRSKSSISSLKTDETLSTTLAQSASSASSVHQSDFGPGSLQRRVSEKSVSSSIKSDQSDMTNMGAGSSSSPISQTSTSNLLNSWKQKAADKQAIQASMNQAKDAMNSWRSKWKTYRDVQQQQASGGNEMGDSQDPLAFGVHEADTNPSIDPTGTRGGQSVAMPSHTYSQSQSSSDSMRSASPASIGRLSISPVTQPFSKNTEGARTPPAAPETKSRSNSLLSGSPNSPFKPSGGTATTSLNTQDAPVFVPSTSPPASSAGHSQSKADSDIRSAPNTQSSIRRVPPPSATASRPSKPATGPAMGSSPSSSAYGYRPTTMMAIPGMDDSRRLALSSEDFKPDRSPPEPSSVTSTADSVAQPADVPPLPPRPRSSSSIVSAAASTGATPIAAGEPVVKPEPVHKAPPPFAGEHAPWVETKKTAEPPLSEASTVGAQSAVPTDGPEEASLVPPPLPSRPRPKPPTFVPDAQEQTQAVPALEFEPPTPSPEPEAGRSLPSSDEREPRE